MPEGDSEYGCFIDQNTLECNLCVQRTIRRRIIERSRPMPPAFRMLPKMIIHFNYTNSGVNEYSRVLNNYKPPFKKLNGYVCIWFRLIMSGVHNTHQVTKSVWIVTKLDKSKSLEQLKKKLESFDSFRETLHALSKK